MTTDRFGMDQDPGITVELAKDAAEGALRLVIYDQVFTVTARSMVDLIHKANIALQDWIAVVFTELVELPEPQEPFVVGQASLPDWLTPEELERFAAGGIVLDAEGLARQLTTSPAEPVRAAGRAEKGA